MALKFKKYKIEIGSNSNDKYIWIFHSEILNNEWDFGVALNNENVMDVFFTFKHEEDLVKFILKWG